MIGLLAISQARDYTFKGDEIKAYEVAPLGTVGFGEEITSGSVTSKFDSASQCSNSFQPAAPAEVHSVHI